MNIVWVLVATVSGGHGLVSVVPTMEFTTPQKCQAAILEFVNDAPGKTGSAKMRCVRIEK